MFTRHDPSRVVMLLVAGGLFCHDTWSWAAEFRWQFRLLVYAGRIELGLSQA